MLYLTIFLKKIDESTGPFDLIPINKIYTKIFRKRKRKFWEVL